MKKNTKQNNSGGNLKKMTLKDYYNKIPTSSAPRKLFVEEVAGLCGVTPQTVRNWCIYGMKPTNYRHARVLSEITGISEEDLWKD